MSGTSAVIPAAAPAMMDCNVPSTADPRVGSLACARRLFGSMPLMAYIASALLGAVSGSSSFAFSTLISACSLFSLGAIKSQFGAGVWWHSGIEVGVIDDFAAHRPHSPPAALAPCSGVDGVAPCEPALAPRLSLKRPRASPPPRRSLGSVASPRRSPSSRRASSTPTSGADPLPGTEGGREGLACERGTGLRGRTVSGLAREAWTVMVLAPRAAQR